MPTNTDHIEFLHTLDGEIEGAAMTLCSLDLQWAEYVETHGIKVKPFFAAIANEAKGYTWGGRTLGTWSSQTSFAGTVLREFSEDGTAVSAYQMLGEWNDERVANGQRPMWNVQSIAKRDQKAAAKAKADEAAADTAEPTATADTANGTALETILGLLPHLTAAELVTASETIATLLTVKAAA